MQRWQGLEDVPPDWGRCVVTIGVFDGVHRGHQRIVARARQIAAARSLPVVVVTFDPHPAAVVRPGSDPPLLCTARRRAQLLAELGAGAVCLLAFTRAFSQLGPDEFVHAALAGRLHAAAVAVGENFRFGHRAAGDVPLLAELGEKYDFTVEGVPLLTDADRVISSSGVRDLIGDGDVGAAARLLGRPHRVEGIVVRGRQRGRALGFPTANLRPPPRTAIPADGVYAGWLARLDPDGIAADCWPAAISVGRNPTFDGQDRIVEAYALDRDDLDLYGAQVGVDFAQRLRDMTRFGSVPELVIQMRRDADAARAIIAAADGADGPSLPL